MDDPSWQRNCNLLAGALQALDQSTSQIRRSTNKLFSLRDIATERERVKRVVSSANAKGVQTIQDALEFMEKYMRLHPTQPWGQGVKLSTEAKVALDNYQKACDSFYKQCISVEDSLRSNKGQTRVRISGGLSSAGSEAEDLDEGRRLLPGSGGLTQREEFENALHHEIMAERQRETSEIAENVRDINEIFTHIHTMVEEQGEALTAIEKNTDASAQSTRNAVRHLQQAHQHVGTSNRDKILVLLIVLLIVGVVVTIYKR
ncbi:syntaxin [Trypanosoma vivax]|nr:syntaxin [Trypanosoma vivax]